jgi:hypothetical protein
MPSLTPVDYDPFQTGPTLTPVDHDPWAAGDDSVRQINMPDVGAPPVNLGYTQDWQPIGQAGDAARAAIGGIASIPQRAIEGSAADVATMGSGQPMQSVGPAADATMLLAGGAPLTAEKGAAGIFGGRLMKTADHNAIARAESMESVGSKPDAIWSMTGTARGADGQWRQEIDDSQAKLKMNPADIPATEIDPNNVSRSGDFTKTAYLDDVLHHPELYKAYPHVKDLEVAPLPADKVAQGFRGDFDGTTIRVSPNLSPDDAKSTILHEVQHAVQKAEGFAQGDSPIRRIPAALAPAESAFNKVKATTESEVAKNLGTNQSGVNLMKAIVRGDNLDDFGVAPEHQQFFRQILDQNPDVSSRLQNIVKSEQMIADAHDKAFTAYKRSMGETESRNVQARMDMTAGERHATPPVITEDTPRFLQRDSRPNLVPVSHDPFAK